MTASAFSKNRQRHERLEHLQAQSALAADRERRITAIPDSTVDHDPGLADIQAHLGTIEREMQAINDARDEIDRRRIIPERIEALEQEIAAQRAAVLQLELAAVMECDTSAASAVAGRHTLRVLEDQQASLLSGWRQFLATFDANLTDHYLAELQTLHRDTLARMTRARQRLKAALLDDRQNPAEELRRMGNHRDDVMGGRPSTSTRRR